MSALSPAVLPAQAPTARIYLLGTVGYESCLTLQQRLMSDALRETNRRLSIVLCEHPPLITIGRQGSAGHLRLSKKELAKRSLEVQWVNRGGGVWQFGPGQLAVYVVAPLFRLGWSVGDYLSRFQGGLSACMREMRIQTTDRPTETSKVMPTDIMAGPSASSPLWRGVCGRGGVLAQIGVSVRNWIAYHGAIVHVAKQNEPAGLVMAVPGLQGEVSSLMAQRQGKVRMTAVRESIARHLAAAFECRESSFFSYHPYLGERRTTMPRAGTTHHEL